nr:hypothetical protein [Archaeoglobus sulfaticallidus]
MAQGKNDKNDSQILSSNKAENLPNLPNHQKLQEKIGKIPVRRQKKPKKIDKETEEIVVKAYKINLDPVNLEKKMEEIYGFHIPHNTKSCIKMLHNDRISKRVRIQRWRNSIDLCSCKNIYYNRQLKAYQSI